MKCMICKHGETKEGATTVTLEKDSSTIVFKVSTAELNSAVFRKKYYEL